jgi:adenylate kinase
MNMATSSNRKIIIVSGTPGTGKTFYSKRIAKEKKYLYFDLNEFIKSNKLYEKFDKKDKTFEVDIKKMNTSIINFINAFHKYGSKKFGGIVIDSHLSHYIPKKYVDECIIVKCPIEILNKRLKKRGYDKKKIQDNLQAEIFDVCYEEAKRVGHNIKIIKNN